MPSCKLVVALLAFAIGGGIQLMNMTEPLLDRDIVVIKESAVVEKYLSKYRDEIGEDYNGYKNHIYRVMSYAHHFLGSKLYEEHAKEIEVALVYHDIGLWTDQKLDYLDPSWARARADVKAEFDEDQLEMIKNIIIYHHKFTPFKGKHSKVVNAVRRGDWIDASMTLFTHGIPREQVRKVQQEIPNAGFHDTLRQFFFGTRVNGWNVFKSINEGRKIFYF